MAEKSCLRSVKILFSYILKLENFLFSRKKQFVFYWKTFCFSLEYTKQTAHLQRVFCSFCLKNVMIYCRKCIVMYSCLCHYTLINLLVIS